MKQVYQQLTQYRGTGMFGLFVFSHCSTINRMYCLKVLLHRLTHHRNHHSLTVAKISNVDPKKSAMLLEMEKSDIDRNRFALQV
jgi:hypothetical protein